MVKPLQQSQPSQLATKANYFSIFAVALVLVNAFLQDIAALYNWSWEFRRSLTLVDFGFDLVFTIEFLIRAFYARAGGRFKRYFMNERGWVDCITSVPLLLFNSGPSFYSIVTGNVLIFTLGNVAKVLKVIKIIRVARVLRILRILKIFRRIRSADSLMAQRHVARITTISITTFVIALLTITVIDTFVSFPSLRETYKNLGINDIQQNVSMSMTDDDIAQSLADNPIILRIVEQERIRYSLYSDEYYRKYFGPDDYLYINAGTFSFYVDIRAIHAADSWDNIVNFIVILSLVSAYLFIYSPHFAITITDPIHIMRRGLSEKTYNLEVNIPEIYQEDDIYRLSKQFNEIYLPLKDRSNTDENSQDADIDIDDIHKALQ